MRGRKPAYNLRIISYPDTSEPPTVHLCRGESEEPILTGELMEPPELAKLIRWARGRKIRITRQGQLFEGAATSQDRPPDLLK